MSEHASWNPKYMADRYGRPVKIQHMTIGQTNNCIRDSKLKLNIIQNNMDGLYERRFVLMQKEDSTYTRKDTKLKIVQAMGLKKAAKADSNSESLRLKHILSLALGYLQEGKSHSLIEAILKQARDDE
tara:strand:- start:1881 stop:2264 length:384 start_codon:yes stop_codon:yes gene_type:complete